MKGCFWNQREQGGYLHLSDSYLIPPICLMQEPRAGWQLGRSLVQGSYREPVSPVGRAPGTAGQEAARVQDEQDDYFRLLHPAILSREVSAAAQTAMERRE